MSVGRLSKVSLPEPNLANSAGRLARLASAYIVAFCKKILLDALLPGSVRTGVRCVAFEDSTTILDNGERIEADVPVGTDGISFIIREGLHGPETPRYAGYTCWRGIRDDNGFLPERSALLVMGGGSQFGAWHCGL